MVSRNLQYQVKKEIEKITRLGRMNSTTGWKSTNRTKMNNYRDFRKRYQNIRFGKIKSGLAELSNRHEKFWTLNSEIREN